jgi:dihydroneopterin aldolase
LIRQLDISWETNIILGNENFEKYKKRKILIDISLRFPEKNIACSSDNIDDAVCYAKLSSFLNERLEKTEFNLLERAARFVYDEISSYLNDATILKSVRIVKPAPPATDLKSASFSCSDW